MEVSGIVIRRVPSFSGAGIDTRRSSSCSSSSSQPSPGGVSVDGRSRLPGKLRIKGVKDFGVYEAPRKQPGILNSGFYDRGHVQYYHGSPRCSAKKKDKGEGGSDMVTTKKKLKLLKGLSKELSMFSQMGFGVNPDDGLVGEVQGKMISEAAEVLVKQLEQLRAEEKELKKKRKKEKANQKATRMRTMVDMDSSSSESSSNSSSSESECEQVVDMSNRRYKTEALAQPNKNEAPTATLPVSFNPEENTSEEKGSVSSHSCQNHEEESSSSPSTSCSSSGTMRIEVCMGNKCMKMGGAALLEEFERVMGIEGVAVACKCLGKCKDGPNVRVLNSVEEAMDDSVRTPSNTLCIGVGLEDVDVIVSHYFGDFGKGFGLAPAP